MQRQKTVTELKASGKGTKVTPETFAAWKERKRKVRQEEARKKVEQEFRKKKGGKGLSVLSGRDLYEYKKELFDKTDDDDEEMAGGDTNGSSVDQVAAKVQSDLFLEGGDGDLDDIVEE